MLKLLGIISLKCLVLHKVSFHQLCARVGAVIIVDFYIDDFIFALFIFMIDGKAVNYNGGHVGQCQW